MLRDFLVCLIVAAATAGAQCPPWTLHWSGPEAYNITHNGTLDANDVTIHLSDTRKDAKRQQICVYSNIRFASPPIGELRFAAPEYPPREGLPPALQGVSCIQVTGTNSVPGLHQLQDESDCIGSFYGNISEDCLFLDVYVPQAAAPPNGTLPVVVWIYGGAYLFGSKTQFDPSIAPFYVGDGFVNTATSYGASMIFVTGNYRLGAFGWLAGTYMEQHAQPNAGLLDQRAILRFVHDHVQSNPDNVSVWGQSAGASSIMHHLTVPPNTMHNTSQPLFRRAILQSPAYQWLWDRNGSLNDTYSDFAKSAGCPSGNITCLRAIDVAHLTRVNQASFRDPVEFGVMPVGPAVDGDLIPHLASYSFAQDQAMSLDTIAISHVDLEVPYSTSSDHSSFIPLPIRKQPHEEQPFQDFLNATFPGAKYLHIRSNITRKYPSSAYSDQIARAADVIRDSGFTCNTRFIAEHYLRSLRPVYTMNYAVFMKYSIYTLNGSIHSSDLFPAFANAATSYINLIQCALDTSYLTAALADYILRQDVAPVMQEMFTKHAIFGDPNHGCDNERCTYEWKLAEMKSCDNETEAHTCVWNAMVPQTDASFFYLTQNYVWHNNSGPDLQTSSDVCDFWNEVAVNVTRIASADDRHGREDLLEVVFSEEL